MGDETDTGVDNANKEIAGNSAQDKRSDMRLLIGLIIAAAGTIMGAYLFPSSLEAYSPWILVLAFGLIAAYGFYLTTYDRPRLPVLLHSYLMALAAILVAPMFWVSAFSFADRFFAVLPLIAVFFAVARTALIGAVPDMVIARRDFDQ
jgi:hypothetical protein